MDPLSGVLVDPRPVFIRGAYNYDTDHVSRATGLLCEDESLAVQSQKDEADINVLVRRFGLTGAMPEGVRVPMYGDFTGISDFRTALDAVREAQNSFMEMPAEVRARFRNDPQLFLEFCADEKNLPEMRKLGLAVPEAPVPPTEPKAP